jgi:hypothetical protein
VRRSSFHGAIHFGYSCASDNGAGLPGCMPSASAIEGQTFSQVKDVAIGDVERFVARGRGLARPGDGARQQIDIDRL